MRVIDQRFQHSGLAADFAHDGFEGWFVLIENEFIEQEVTAQWAGDAITGLGVFFPGLHPGAMGVPEVGRQIARTGIEQVGVFQHLVVEVVFCEQAQCPRLDPHIDVFGHQNDRATGVFELQEEDDAQNLVVVFGGRQRRR